ncbi:MAG: zinc ribbon domain-containing protein [Ruminococcus sp.]
MSFFDKLGKTITDTTHTVVEKTKSSTDTIRLNGLINDEERSINAAYLNMGKKYAELHGQDAEPEFQEYLDAITASQQKIEEYREQIRKNKHLLICQSCGAEIPETVLYCTKCGADNPVGKQLAEERAAKEAAERAAREAAAQQAAAQQAAAQQAAAAQPNYTQPAAGVELCQNCGKPRTPGAMFCTSCGTRFVPTQPVQTEALSAPAPAAAIPTPAPAEMSVSHCYDPAIATLPSEEETATATTDTVTPTPASADDTDIPVGGSVTITSAPTEDTATPAADTVTPAEEPASIPEPVSASGRTCPTCGKEVPEQYKFCTSCGTKVDDTDTPVSSPEKTCPVCGKTVPAQNKFCTNCGTKVED